MKLVKQFTINLDKLDLSGERKADLLAKYLSASAKTESEMNEYFEVIPPESDKKKRGKSKGNSKNKKPKTQYVSKGHSYYVGERSSFDHRARLTIDVHIDSDESLDKKYFKNS